MYFRWAAILLLGSLAMGQAAAPNSPKPTPKPAAQSGAAKTQTTQPATEATSGLAPNTPVITISGVCDTPGTAAQAAAECKTVVTRAEFERLANALQPNMPTNVQRRLADAYPKIFLMAHEAHQRGLEKQPRFKDLMEFARMNALAQELSRTLKDEADKVPEPEIENYYKSNGATFEEASLLRLFIPREKQTEGAAEKPAETQAQGEEAMKKEAETLRERAAAGEDFDKLQKEAYDGADVKATPPTTNLGKLTRGELPANHRAVIDLAAGQVSPLLTEANGYYVYKVVSKSTRSLDDSRDKIRTMLAQQRLQAAIEQVQESGKAELNEAYFGGGASPAPRMQPPSGAKANESNQQPPK
jgi:hypothetical protein